MFNCKTLDWKGPGVNINGDHRFVNDIVIVADAMQELQHMLQSLVNSSGHIGLWMNLDKTKIMFNEHIIPGQIALNGIAVEVLQEYICLEIAKNYFETEAK